jgi:hypothetical protein
LNPPSQRKNSALPRFWTSRALSIQPGPAIIAALGKRLCLPYLIKTVLSFLSNRKALISINGGCLKQSIHIGCPQGGVLSPFLWNLLAHDLLRTTFPFPIKFVVYADNITVATIHKDAALATRNLQAVCHFLEKWLAVWNLFLNAAKTVFILFSRKRLPHPNLFIFLNGVKIFPTQ